MAAMERFYSDHAANPLVASQFAVYPMQVMEPGTSFEDIGPGFFLRAWRDTRSYIAREVDDEFLSRGGGW